MGQPPEKANEKSKNGSIKTNSGELDLHTLHYNIYIPRVHLFSNKIK